MTITTQRSTASTVAAAMLAALGLTSSPTAQAGQVWKLADAITINNGVITLAAPWSLLWRTGPTCFGVNSSPVTNAYFQGGGALGGWHGGQGGNFPSISKNFSATSFVGPDGATVSPGEVVVWPGPPINAWWYALPYRQSSR